MGIFELLLLSVGLAMDAFAVSVCKGLSVKKTSVKECLICGIWFGAFQGIMPFIGYLIGSGFEKWISIVAPWVAFALLSLIGINMIREAFSEETEEKAGFDLKTMFLMAVATSIDALAVGITFVAVPVHVFDMSKLQNTIFAVIVIAVVTFTISALGVKIGNLFGSRYRSGSEVMGGTILIFIGLKTLIGYLDKSDAMSDSDNIFGMLIPFIGTALGAASVYAKKLKLSEKIRVLMAGATAGIMFSISVWGMIEPAASGFNKNGIRAVFPLFICFCAGVAVQYALDSVVPHTHAFVGITEGPQSSLKAETKMMLAEVIHHVPEGIALGAIYAAHFMKTDWIPASTPLFLAVALAIQNFPEAVFVSLPVMEKGTGKGKSFFMGVVSGMPVPIAAVFILIIIVLFPASLPYIMAVAGGAMIYTTVEELPLMVGGKDNDGGAFAFVIGFAVIMLLIFAK
ncbi:MAG: manganese efflux pump [Lachnospiraceae bacterium]|nr:manganese efflux pump [Lachnospiraceae bacterium]